MFDTFNSPGQFFKGNLHTHSTKSDGVLSPEEVCRIYRDAGYDFICISDHFREKYAFPITDTSSFRTERFTTLLGAEVHAPQTHLGFAWHILAAGLPLDFPATSKDEDGPSLARRAAEAGAFVGIAHPQFYGLDITDGRALDAAHAVEIYNHGCEMLSGRPDGVSLWDNLLSEGRKLTGFASDDAHFECDDSFGGWVYVKADALEPDALLTALKAGHYYASQGPTIEDVSLRDNKVIVRCSPVRSIAVAGRGPSYDVVHGKGITEARFDVEQFSGSWCRLVITERSGKRAWAQPAWID